MANGRASGLGVQMISRVNVLSMLRRQGPCQCAKPSLTSRAGASRREFHATGAQRVIDYVVWRKGGYTSTSAALRLRSRDGTYHVPCYWRLRN